MKGRKDMIRAALQDARNGKISTIYQRISKTGSPFKMQDKRCTKGGIYKKYPNGITPQLVQWRINHGWDVDKATTVPPRIRSKHDEQGTRENIPDAILAQ